MIIRASCAPAQWDFIGAQKNVEYYFLSNISFNPCAELYDCI